MICTVLVIWFAVVAIAGIVIGSYDNESARVMIVGIVVGTVLFLSLVKSKHFDFGLKVENTNYGKRIERKA